MKLETVVQKFGAFSVIAAIVLLIINIAIQNPSLFSYVPPIVMFIAGVAMVVSDKNRRPKAE